MEKSITQIDETKNRYIVCHINVDGDVQTKQFNEALLKNQGLDLKTCRIGKGSRVVPKGRKKVGKIKQSVLNENAKCLLTETNTITMDSSTNINSLCDNTVYNNEADKEHIQRYQFIHDSKTDENEDGLEIQNVIDHDRSYINHKSSQILDTTVTSLLTTLAERQNQLYPSHKRAIFETLKFGFKEAMKDRGTMTKVHLVIIARNLSISHGKGNTNACAALIKHCMVTQGAHGACLKNVKVLLCLDSINETIHKIIETNKKRNVQTLFSLTRNVLGRKSTRQSCVTIIGKDLPPKCQDDLNIILINLNELLRNQ